MVEMRYLNLTSIFVENRNKSGQELPSQSIFIATNVYYNTINREWDDIRHHVTLWSDCKLHLWCDAYRSNTAL